MCHNYTCNNHSLVYLLHQSSYRLKSPKDPLEITSAISQAGTVGFLFPYAAYWKLSLRCGDPFGVVDIELMQDFLLNSFNLWRLEC